MARVCPQGSGEVSSASEYFSCVSSPRKLIHGGKGTGILECRGAWLWSRDRDPNKAEQKPRVLRGGQGSVEEPGEDI